MQSKSPQKFTPIVALLSGSFLFCVAEALLKFLTNNYSPYEIMFCKSMILFVIIIMIAFFKTKLKAFRTSQLKMHLLRSSFSASSSLFATKALSGLQIYSFKALNFLCPVFTITIGIIFLKEKLNLQYMLAFCCCLIGVSIIFRPGIDVYSIYGAYSLVAALCGSLAILVFKRMVNTESTYAIIFYYSLCSLAIALATVDFKNFQFSNKDVPLFIIVSVIHIMASFLFTFGMRSQKLITISLINYTSLPFSLFLGWAIWHDFPVTNMMISSLLILLGNIFLLPKSITTRRVE